MQYVVLESLEHGTRFYTTNPSDDDPTLSATGEKWYRVIGYADTGDQARRVIMEMHLEDFEIIDY